MKGGNLSKIENSNYYVVGQQIYSDKDKPIKYWLDKDSYLGLGGGLSKYYIRQYGKIRGKDVI